MKYITAQPTSFKRRLANTAVIGLLVTSFSAMLAPSLIPDVFAQNANVGSRIITISPPSLPLNLKPGDKKEGTIGLINDTATDLIFDVSVFDMIVQDEDGTPEFLPGGTIQNNKYSASSWIGVDHPVLTVKANSRADLNYFAQVPANAGPGGHYAGIVYKPRVATTANRSGAAVAQQVATLVYFDVAGPIKESANVKTFTAPGFSEYGPVPVAAEVTNNGDTHIRAKGTIQVKDMLGKTIVSKDIPEGNIFPGGISRIYKEAVGSHIMIGRYVATFNATYGRSNNLPLVASVSFWVFPWKIALVILVLIGAAVLGYLYMKKNKKHQTPEAQTTTTTSTTTTQN